MTYDQIVQHYGSADKAAQAIGLKSRQTLYVWRDKGRVPLEHQVKFEVDTGGKLRANIPPELRRRAPARAAAVPV